MILNGRFLGLGLMLKLGVCVAAESAIFCNFIPLKLFYEILLLRNASSFFYCFVCTGNRGS